MSLLVFGSLLSLFLNFQSYMFQSPSLTFILPGEIQETTIPITLDWMYSHYSPHGITLEQNKERYESMIVSGVRCKLYEIEPREEFKNSDDEYFLDPWNSPYTYINCLQVPIYLKEYYLPRRNLRIKEPAIEDWWSGQHDPQRKGSLVVSGNFLYSHIYDSNYPEKQELSDHHNGKDFSFFFMVRYQEVPPYQQIEDFIRVWSKLAYPKKDTAQFIIKENKKSKGKKEFWVYTPYKRKKKNAKQGIRKLFHYFIWCSPEKKQCLVHINNKLLPVLGSTRTDYFGKIEPFNR